MTKPTKWHVRPAKNQISRHPPSQIRVFAVHMKKPWALSYLLSTQQRLWSDLADAQADMSLRWARRSFFHVAAHTALPEQWFHQLQHFLSVFVPHGCACVYHRHISELWILISVRLCVFRSITGCFSLLFLPFDVNSRVIIGQSVNQDIMSHLMRLWHFLSSVKSFVKRTCAAIQWG